MPGRRRSSSRGRRGAYSGAAAGRTSDRDSQQPPNPQEQARNICLRLLAVRPRTRVELATALRRRGVPDDAAEAVLERFGEVGMIDDAAFAEAWVTSRHHGRGLARRALGHELRSRGVDGATVRDALDQLDPDTEEQTARDLVRRRLRSMSSTPSDVAFRRLGGMLARKGYPAGLAVRVIRDALAERSAADDLLDGIGPDLDTLVDIAEAEVAEAADAVRQPEIAASAPDDGADHAGESRDPH